MIKVHKQVCSVLAKEAFPDNICILARPGNYKAMQIAVNEIARINAIGVCVAYEHAIGTDIYSVLAKKYGISKGYACRIAKDAVDWIRCFEELVTVGTDNIDGTELEHKFGYLLEKYDILDSRYVLREDKDATVSALELPFKTTRSLMAAGINTIGELTEVIQEKDDWYIDIRNVNETMANTIVNLLERKRLM